MNELKIFEHPKFGKIRTITEDGKTLFCGVDAAKALGYKDTTNAIKRHCRWVAKRHLGVQTGLTADGRPAFQTVEMNFIPEGDLCRLAAKSEMPGADTFERWIFDEVIPSVLRTGSYTMPDQPALPRLHLPDGVSFTGLAKLITATRTVMIDMGSTGAEIGAVTKGLYAVCGIPLDKAFSSQLPGQTSFWDRPALEN